jgi:hypothetical protein
MQFFSFVQSLNRLELIVFPILQGLFTYVFLKPFGENGILGAESVAAAFSFAVLASLFCIKTIRLSVSYMKRKKSPTKN